MSSQCELCNAKVALLYLNGLTKRTQSPTARAST